MTRREHIWSLAAAAARPDADNQVTAFTQATLPTGIRSRFVSNVNGLTVHILEAGFEERGRPCVLLLHGFPELAYSWRKVMPALASAGYHVVAPDQRGYGRTTGWDERYDGDAGSFRMLNIVRDAIGLVSALGLKKIDCVVGHDFGSPVAGWCALLRPDLFRSVVLMSAPFGGPASIPMDTAEKPTPTPPDIHAGLASLTPPRKHYQWYYATREADGNMHRCPQGIHAFMRAYYHFKSADWKDSRPFPLQSWTATELEKLPTYYVMDLAKGMAETAASAMPSQREIASCQWLTDQELSVYAAEYQRTGFQGGLNWYRCATSPLYSADLEIFSGRRIDVPACFISGKSDWGIYQQPGALERMRNQVCKRMTGFHLVERAGHWVQQEQSGQTVRLLLAFLRERRQEVSGAA